MQTMTITFDAMLQAKENNTRSTILFPAHGLKIYEFMVEQIKKNEYVKLEEVFEKFNFEDTSTMRRDFRHYHNDVEEYYFADIIKYCFNSSSKGSYIATPEEKADKHYRRAMKELYKYSKYRNKASQEYQDKLILEEVVND